MGVKKTPDLIPMCHPVPLNGINLSFYPEEENLRIRIVAETVCDGKAGGVHGEFHREQGGEESI